VPVEVVRYDEARGRLLRAEPTGDQDGDGERQRHPCRDGDQQDYEHPLIMRAAATQALDFHKIGTIYPPNIGVPLTM
jgi:hypothetical protein